MNFKFLCFCVTAVLVTISLAKKSELITFVNTAPERKPTWSKIDFTNFTTLCIYNHNQEFIDMVNQQTNNSVKFQTIISDYIMTKEQWKHATHIDYVINNLVKYVIEYNLDGINIDIEGSYHGSEMNNGIDYFVKNLYQKLKSINSEYLLTYDVPYDPESLSCITGRCQDWGYIAKFTDHLYIMDYDAELWRIAIGECTDPFERILAGTRKYLDQDGQFAVPSEKLVHMVPWYSHRYRCYNPLSPGKFETCVTNTVLTQDSPGFCAVHQTYKPMSIKQGFTQIYDKYEHCHHFMFYDENNKNYYDLWYDDIETLQYKLDNIAIKYKLGGVGSWWSLSSDWSVDGCPEIMEPYYQQLRDVKMRLDSDSDKISFEVISNSDDEIFEKL